jgi:orotidine-5'-phosphate decarboxylase
MSHLIIALDVSSQREALDLVDELGDDATWFKVGLELYTREGPGVVRALKGRGKRIFLDLKLLDIPNTVARAVESAGDLGVDLLTIHAQGGETMVRAAVRAAEEHQLSILAVTILTSLSPQDVAGVWGRPVEDVRGEVLRLARAATGWGAHGVVASAQEARELREALGPDPLVVTPGIRMAGGEHHDQLRVATPAAAVQDGASHLVVGRAITAAPDRREALEAVLQDMARALR